MIDKRSSVPLYVQIQNLLAEQIRAGELQSGHQVPSETEIATQHNISRMTARKALESLVAKGILYRRKGKGTYVAEHVMAYGMSTILSFSGTFSARGHQVTTKVLSSAVIPASDYIRESLHLAPYTQMIVIRRLRLVDDVPAAIHTSYLDHRIFAPILEMDLSKASLLEAIQETLGLPVAYSRDAVQAVLPNREEAELLGSAPNDPALEVEGVAYAEGGQPIRLTRGLYRGDLFKLTVTNTATQPASLNMVSDGAG